MGGAYAALAGAGLVLFLRDIQDGHIDLDSRYVALVLLALALTIVGEWAPQVASGLAILFLFVVLAEPNFPHMSAKVRGK